MRREGRSGAALAPAVLAVGAMANTAAMGATYDVDGGRQLLAG